MKIGILGSGRIIKNQIEAMIASEYCQPYAISSRSPDKARVLANTYSLKVYNNPMELLQDPSIDIVYIGLPNDVHYEWAERCLLSGKHVLVDKPITQYVTELLKLRKIVEETGKLIMEGFMYRTHPVVDKLVEIINHGDIGTIKHIDFTFCHDISGYLGGKDNYRYYQKEGGGALLDLGIYCVDFFQFFISKLDDTIHPDETEVQILSATQKKFNFEEISQVDKDKEPADVTTLASMNYRSSDNEIICNLLCSFEFMRTVLWIGGTEGNIEVRDLTSQGTKEIRINKYNEVNIIEISGNNTYAMMYDALYQSIQNDQPLLISLKESQKNLRMVDQIIQSATIVEAE